MFSDFCLWPMNEKLDRGWLQHCIIQYCLKVTSTGTNMKELCVSEDHVVGHQIGYVRFRCERGLFLFLPQGFTVTTERLFPADSLSSIPLHYN